MTTIYINGEPVSTEPATANSAFGTIRQPSWVEALEAAEREMQNAASETNDNMVRNRLDAAAMWVRIAEVYAANR